MFTPLTKTLQPLYPVLCPICGASLGALYRDGHSLKPHTQRCSERCERLWLSGRGKGRWRDMPADLRAPYLAAGVLENDATAQSS